MGRIKTEYAPYLLKELYDHSVEGKICAVIGPMGSMKTTFMLHSAKALSKSDYVLFRDHPDDPQFKNYPDGIENVIVHYFEEDEIEIEKVDEKGVEELDVKTRSYCDAEELLKHVRKGKLNVVWEPREFEPSEDFIRGIEQTINKPILPDLPNLVFDPSWFWFELSYVLLHRSDTRRYSLMWDEAGDIMLFNPPGIRWHVQDWFCRRAMKLRGSGISLYMAAHDSNVFLDHRLKPLIMFYVFLPGAKVPVGCSVNKVLPKKLPMGWAIIEATKPIEFKGKQISFSSFEIGKLNYANCRVRLNLKSKLRREMEQYA